ncbi:flagellar basal body rod protein FlgC [Nocardioides caldifontis]|uniref:flagellar basal body rod protein FlgC n=1 Tax=Nocardioides caldifontis TaxID=2588938 RepID=UPI0011E00561|nr:flagellar basal body rod C-terminal domain-containing protein [Nocardioides caldifontis]
MGAFEMLRIANTSLGMHQTWLDALAHNISNVNTMKSTDEEAFRAQLVRAQSRADGGVDVDGIELSDGEGRLVYSPDHPLADEDGMVRGPDMDLGSQMTQLVMAQRGYQASVQVTKNAQDTYSSALQIGK